MHRIDAWNRFMFICDIGLPFSPSDNISSTEMRNELFHVKFNLATPLQATTDII